MKHYVCVAPEFVEAYGVQDSDASHGLSPDSSLGLGLANKST